MVFGFLKKAFEKVSSWYSGRNEVKETRVFRGEDYKNKEERQRAYQYWKWDNFGAVESAYADAKNATRRITERWDEKDSQITDFYENRYQKAQDKIEQRRFYSDIFNTRTSPKYVSLPKSLERVAKPEEPVKYSLDGEVKIRPFDIFDTSRSPDSIRLSDDYLERQEGVDVFNAFAGVQPVEDSYA